jgi:hypothetical protein
VILFDGISGFRLFFICVHPRDPRFSPGLIFGSMFRRDDFDKVAALGWIKGAPPQICLKI